MKRILFILLSLLCASPIIAQNALNLKADNIVGTLPATDELIESARPLVRLQGIHGELKPRLEAFSWNRK